MKLPRLPGLRAGDDPSRTAVPRPAAGEAPLGDEPDRPLGVDPAPGSADELAVPRGVQTAAAWCWRVVVIVVVLLGVGWVLEYLSEVTIPIAVAILLTAMLTPVAARLRKWGVRNSIATTITVIGGIVVVAGAFTLIGTQIASQSGEVADQVVNGFDQIIAWMKTSPFKSFVPQITDFVSNLQQFLIDSRSTIASYAADIGTSVGHFVAGLAITIFALFYFLAEGRTMWTFLLRLFPRRSRGAVDRASLKGWVSLTSYVRATIVVALADGVGVLIIALALQVKLAPALAALVFIGAFIPIIGALVAGVVAVLVALVFLGAIKALIMLVLIVVLLELEGHVLRPFLLGRAVKLHPLAVLLGIAVGVILGGIVGALLSIPLLAFVKTFAADIAKDGGQVVDPGAVASEPA